MTNDEEPKWHGFQPTGYSIDWPVFLGAPLKELRDGTAVDTTVEAVIQALLPAQFGPPDRAKDALRRPGDRYAEGEHRSGRVTFSSPNRADLTLDVMGNGTAAAADILAALVEIDGKIGPGAPLNPVFFYFDSDHVTDELHESFSFFVVNDERIVLEGFSLGKYRESGFRPEFLEPAYVSENPIWRNEPSVLDARVRLWYKRFYEGTQTGQLTLLRDDVSVFNYVRQAAPAPIGRTVELQPATAVADSTAGIQRLLLIAVILLAVIAFELWK